MLRLSNIFLVSTAVLCLMLLSGCATPEQRADRALEAGDHIRALEFYKMEMQKEERDPELYYKAAQAAIESGNLSLAERYYSRSLRYGGGPKVAKALAQYYLQTSNYASAVRVLQRLLDEVEDTQPVYNNLGTALMYSGMHLDAESYLLVAQQMEPENPIPYLNLGLLYDEHLNKPRLARGFYRCYIEMGEQMKQIRKVGVRVKELDRRWGQLPPQFQVECGKPYEPGVPSGSAQKLAKLRELSEQESDEGEATEEEEDGESDAEEAIDLGFAGDDASDTDSLPSIETQVEARAGTGDRGQTRSEETLETLERAERAFAASEFEKVVRLFSELPIDVLNPRNAAIYGIALYEVGQSSDAEQWLEHSLEGRPTQRVFKKLVELYKRTDATAELTRICKEYSTHPNLKEAVDDVCPETEISEDAKEDVRRRLKQRGGANP